MNFWGQSWLLFDRVIGVSVIGEFLDGRGTSLYACKTSNQQACNTFLIDCALTQQIWNSLNCMIHVTCWKECGMFQVKNLQIVDPDIVRFFGFDFLQIWKVRCSLFSKVLRHMLTRLPSSLGFRNDWSDWNRLWLVQIT